jgi:hypothetical protein
MRVMTPTVADPSINATRMRAMICCRSMGDLTCRDTRPFPSLRREDVQPTLGLEDADRLQVATDTRGSGNGSSLVCLGIEDLNRVLVFDRDESGLDGV